MAISDRYPKFAEAVKVLELRIGNTDKSENRLQVSQQHEHRFFDL